MNKADVRNKDETGQTALHLGINNHNFIQIVYHTYAYN